MFPPLPNQTRRSTLWLVVSAVLIAGVLTTTAANAATSSTDAALSAIPGLTDSSKDVQLTAQGSYKAARVGENTILLPKTAGEDVTLASTAGLALKVGIPGQKASSRARNATSSVTVYPDSTTSTDTAVQATDDGSLRMMTIIKDKKAASDFRFPIRLPEGHLSMNADGSIDIINGESDAVGMIQKPWAIDAKKKVLPSSYSLEGNTVVLHVNHTNATYPVVADPNISTNCGITSCTVYFSRSLTYEISVKSQIAVAAAALGAFICAPLGGSALIACGIAVGSITYVSAWFTYAASTGQCAKMTFGLTTNIPSFGTSNSSYCPEGSPSATSLMTHFNNKCLDADLNTINSNGTKVQLWDCNGQSQQKWRFYRDGSIRSAYNGRCLDADLNTIWGNGTKVQLWDCNGQSQQKWTGRSGSLTSNRNGKCLDADLNTINRNGTKVQLWDCNGQPQQQWWN